MAQSRRWSDEQFICASAASRSVAQVLRALGLNATGANYMTVWRTVERLAIDTSHWTGQASNQGTDHVGGCERLTSEEVFVLDRRRGQKEKVAVLRRALLNIGVRECCEACGLKTEWNGQPLRLAVDHKNGNPLDNRRVNLRFLCPNCHSQTATFGIRNVGWRSRVST
jgi:hypothetical protein